MNPTLSIAAWIWSTTYVSIDVGGNSIDFFGQYHLGRYAWAYIICPIIAAPFAGIFARLHLKNISGDVV